MRAVMMGDVPGKEALNSTMTQGWHWWNLRCGGVVRDETREGGSIQTVRLPLPAVDVHLCQSFLKGLTVPRYLSPTASRDVPGLLVPFPLMCSPGRADVFSTVSWLFFSVWGSIAP